MPRPLVRELCVQATRVRDGNKSGFVADALLAYLDMLRKGEHTALLRMSYAAAARHSLSIAREWDASSDQAWAMLDGLKPSGKKRGRR